MISKSEANPFEKARKLQDESHLVLLYSGMEPGKTSIHAWGVADQVNSVEALRGKLGTASEQFENAWFGYFGYGLRNGLEDLPRNKDSVISLPDILMMKFKNVIVFDAYKSPAAKNTSLRT